MNSLSIVALLSHSLFLWIVNTPQIYFVNFAQHSFYSPVAIVAVMDNSILYHLTFTKLIILFLHLQNPQQVFAGAEESFLEDTVSLLLAWQVQSPNYTLHGI